MKRIAIPAALAALAVLGAFGCPGETHCDYVASTPPSGDPLRDIHGCWQSFGSVYLEQDPYNLVIYQFTGMALSSPDGGLVVYKWRDVQPPNNVYPAGLIYDSVFQLGQTDDGGFTPIDLNVPQVYPPAFFRVTDLNVEVFFQPPESPTSLYQPLRRAVCTGFGFDAPLEPCPNGLANQ